MGRTQTATTSEESAETPPAPSVVQRELGDIARSHEQRRRQIPRALLAGTIAGLVAVAFAQTLALGEVLRDRLSEIAASHPGGGLLLWIAIGAVGAGAAVYLVQRFEPDAAGSGIPHVAGVLHHLRGMRWQWILPVKFAGGALGIAGAGLALGREGPTIQMGAAVGQMVSGWFRCTARERQTLIAAGAGAGLSAAFNAPLAGLVFVLEELQRDFAPAILTVTLIASITADVFARSLTTPLPVLEIATHAIPSPAALPIALLLGVLAGLLGVVFNRSLVASLQLFQSMTRLAPWMRGAIVGAAVGVVGWFLPHALAGGQGIVQDVLAGKLALAPLLGFFVLRFALTMASYGCGAPGGIFAPMLVLGATLGMGVGEIALRLLPASSDPPEMFAAVGMAAFFTAVVRAPLTGIVLMVEMTGNYAMILPLLVAALTAGGVADFVKDRPIYEVLLRRDLRRWQHAPELAETLLLDLTIAPGARFEGKRVRELGLPPGAIVISIARGVESEVPTADSVLGAGDRITVVVSPRAAGAVPMLREGAILSR